MLTRVLFLAVFLFSGRTQAQTCPGADDEPALTVKTQAGPSLVLCGFEDHEVRTPKPKRTFTEFSVYAWPAGAKEPQKVFTADPADTHWASALDQKGLELEELWFFGEKPYPAILRAITCGAESCQIAAPKCVLKMKKNPYPKALAKLQKKLKNSGDEGEELLEQIWAQALTGDKAAQAFYDHKPDALDPVLTEEFNANKQKLGQARELGCPSLHAK